MGREGIIDRIKSPLVRNEIIKCLKALDLKPLTKIIHDLLDVQLTVQDVYTVKAEIANLLEQIKTELLRKP